MRCQAAASLATSTPSRLKGPPRVPSLDYCEWTSAEARREAANVKWVGDYFHQGRVFRVEPAQVTQKTGGYEFLWDGSDEGWVVVRTKSGPGAIYNTMTRQALVIEDDDEYEHAIRMMREHGRPFVDSVP